MSALKPGGTGLDTNNLSHVMRKPLLRASNQVQHKPGCTASGDGLRLNISNLGSTCIKVAKTKALICWAVTIPLFLHIQKAGFLMTLATSFCLGYQIYRVVLGLVDTMTGTYVTHKRTLTCILNFLALE